MVCRSSIAQAPVQTINHFFTCTYENERLHHKETDADVLAVKIHIKSRIVTVEGPRGMLPQQSHSDHVNR